MAWTVAALSNPMYRDGGCPGFCVKAESEISNSQSAISIYPNPAHDKFVVSSSEFADRVIIYDMTGREVFIEQLRTTNHELQTTHVSPPAYPAHRIARTTARRGVAC